MNLFLRRLSLTGYATYGQLTDDENTALCVTLERPWLDNAPSVSCIPAGTYPVVRYTSPARGYDVFVLKNVLGRSYIEIHKGNLPTDSEGCILVGQRFGMLGDKHGITGSAEAFERLMDSLRGVDTLTLTITNPSTP